MKMKVIESIPQMRTWCEQNSAKKIALVPTMGFLHEGHLSLIRIARQQAEIVVVSIFINPTQFAQGEDLDTYPRDFTRDKKLCELESVDLIFTPSNQEMYPTNHKTYVITEELSGILCGESRPSHFRGVTTVVAKLFNIIQPNIAIFGQKDAQQAVILKRMVQDLNFNLEIQIAPIIRENDGLAMSSRNKYLSPVQRKEAAILQKSLQLARSEFKHGNLDFEQTKNKMIHMIQDNSSALIDYISFTDASSLASVQDDTRSILVALAVYFGQTRLIDNIILNK